MSKAPFAPSIGKEKDLASLFVACLFPLSSDKDFKPLCEQFLKEYPRADHYPYAFRFRGLSRYSDDGEPSGTAGRPMLSLLEEGDIDGLLIVARYFGGTKLGVPRLRRAFLAAAKQAINEAKLGVYVPAYRYLIEVDYSAYETLKSNGPRMRFHLENEVFDVKVRAELVSGDKLDGLGQKLGLPHLKLPSPQETYILQEVPHDPS